jgi:hypothetical protein
MPAAAFAMTSEEVEHWQKKMLSSRDKRTGVSHV